MFVLLQMIMLIGITESATDLTTTYQRSDPLTGRTLTCQRCPPGSHMVQHCSGSEQTRCAPCPSQHYTQYWNYLSRCLYCNVVCEENQVVKEECSRFHDRICECADGYYMHSGVCRRHTKCPSGQGVKEKGTVHKDTVCEECAQGFYSNRSSAVDTCVKHTDCESLGLRTVLEGTLWHNSLCASCPHREAGGGLEALRDVLPDFFRHQKMKERNLRRFVRLCIRNEVDGTLAEPWTIQLRQDPRGCLDRWLREVEAEKLKKLPVMLKKLNLQHVAYKLENKIHKAETQDPASGKGPLLLCFSRSQAAQDLLTIKEEDARGQRNLSV